MAEKISKGGERGVPQAEPERLIPLHVGGELPVEKTGKGEKAGKKECLDAYLKYGMSFEKAYRDYIQARNKYVDFSLTLNKIQKLEGALDEPSFKSIPDEKALDERSQARLELVMGEATATVDKDEEDDNEKMRAALATIYAEGSKEYKAALAEMTGKQSEEAAPKTKKEVSQEIGHLEGEAKRLWENPMVRY